MLLIHSLYRKCFNRRFMAIWTVWIVSALVAAVLFWQKVEPDIQVSPVHLIYWLPSTAWFLTSVVILVLITLDVTGPGLRNLEALNLTMLVIFILVGAFLGVEVRDGTSIWIRLALFTFFVSWAVVISYDLCWLTAKGNRANWPGLRG